MTPKRALISLTSYHGPFYKDGAKTGVFVVEILRSFDTFKKHGFEVDFVSETGDFGWAGHGALFDYPKAKNLQDIASKIYANGGVIAAICHGPLLFDGLIDIKTTRPLIEGKAITGFPLEGEIALGVDDILRSRKLTTVERVANKNGAKYLAPIHPWDDYSITDGKLVTGVNANSSYSTTIRAINALYS